MGAVKELSMFVIYLYIEGFHIGSFFFMLTVMWYVIHPVIECLIFYFNLILIFIEWLLFGLECFKTAMVYCSQSRFEWLPGRRKANFNFR